MTLSAVVLLRRATVNSDLAIGNREPGTAVLSHGGFAPGASVMDSTTLLIILLVIILLGGGGWYGRGRWY